MPAATSPVAVVGTLRLCGGRGPLAVHSRVVFWKLGAGRCQPQLVELKIPSPLQKSTWYLAGVAHDQSPRQESFRTGHQHTSLSSPGEDNSRTTRELQLPVVILICETSVNNSWQPTPSFARRKAFDKEKRTPLAHRRTTPQHPFFLFPLHSPPPPRSKRNHRSQSAKQPRTRWTSSNTLSKSS